MELIPRQKGVYALILRAEEKRFIVVGNRGGYLIKPGFYAYIGSAQRGLAIRLKRHLNLKKKKHWHIDYLLDYTQPIAVIVSITSKRIECQVAQSLLPLLSFLPGFGVSDCRCKSHLYYHPSLKVLEKEVMKAFSPYPCTFISLK
ncbi:MAG: GIY-YIG nuclease family protein [Candidatus Desulfofervidus auxilii]|nr:GIY-YIG nuclease family protein [Candidatus Desulfofervidus auxilii]